MAWKHISLRAQRRNVAVDGIAKVALNKFPSPYLGDFPQIVRGSPCGIPRQHPALTLTLCCQCRQNQRFRRLAENNCIPAQAPAPGSRTGSSADQQRRPTIIHTGEYIFRVDEVVRQVGPGSSSKVDVAVDPFLDAGLKSMGNP